MKQTPSLYFENAAGRLLEEPAGFLRVVWSSKPRTQPEAQALFTHMTRALHRHGWSRMLIDQRDMVPFSPQEQQWILNEWLPQATAAGYSYGAVVVSPNVMVRLATAYITTQPQHASLNYRSFEAEAEAEAWLLQQPRSAQ